MRVDGDQRTENIVDAFVCTHPFVTAIPSKLEPMPEYKPRMPSFLIVSTATFTADCT